MNIIAFLIPVALLLGLIGLLAFVWAVRSNQFNDPEGAAWRVLSDEDDRPLPNSKDQRDEAKPPGTADR